VSLESSLRFCFAILLTSLWVLVSSDGSPGWLK
jgi:hypothetical protein